MPSPTWSCRVKGDVALVKSVEACGKTLEEAKAAALQELQAAEDAVVLEVLEEPRKLLGFLGASGDFRVRATLAAEVTAEAGDMAAAPAPPTAQVSDAAAERARAFIAETTRLMGLDTEVVVSYTEPGEVTLEIQGQSLGLLIGRHGGTLDALQLLAAVVANSGGQSGARVVVDAEGYRERRREMLRKLAIAQAEKAKQSGQEVVIPDLKAFERRIVHLTLKDDPEVETYSEGEGEERCLVISPRGA
jgi:spoIIIJ-associated protein